MNTNITTQCDRNLARLEKVGNRLPDLINNTALIIVQNPADLAGRSIRLLNLLSGMRCQRNVLEFFGDYLPNDIVKEKGGFSLGKKREGFAMPEFSPENLPFSYSSEAKKAEKAEKLKAAKAEKAEAVRLAQISEAEKQAKQEENEHELSRSISQRAELAEKLGKAELKIAELEKTPKSKLIVEKTALQTKIVELQDSFELAKAQWLETVKALKAENTALKVELAALKGEKAEKAERPKRPTKAKAKAA